MNQRIEIIECDTCRSKSGSPTLCDGCLHNRLMASFLDVPFTHWPTEDNEDDPVGSHSRILENYGTPTKMALTIEDLRSEIEQLEEEMAMERREKNE